MTVTLNGATNGAAPANAVLVWNIAFLPSRERTWWDVFSPRWCRHVVCFGYAASTLTWVVVETARERTVIMSLEEAAFDAWLDDLWRRQPIILRYTAKNARDHEHRLGVWCSTMVARLCGVTGGAWRPLALYRSLRRDGAQAVFGTSPHDHENQAGSRGP